jgi:hypothetical protein
MTAKKKPIETVLSSVDTSIASALWLTPADAGQIKLVRTLAQMIDDWQTNPSDVQELLDMSKALANLLGQLGLNPHGRKQQHFDVEKGVNPLNEIRAKYSGQSNAAPANKTVKQSPKPRKRSQ